MAVVQGQAVRRRAGIAPNTLVMANSGSLLAAERPNTVSCSVGKCGTPLPNPGAATTLAEHGNRLAQYHQHALVDHPRHAVAQAARTYFRNLRST